MKLYKINGNLYTWEQAHNLGYTTTPTEEVTFYSASDSDWGAEVTSGFLDKHSSQAFLDWEYWVSEEQEWNTPDSLMQWPVYPSGGEDVVLTNGSIISDAVRIVDDAGTAWYIIRKAMELSWVDEEELEENGWEPYVDTDYEFILFNTDTGKISGGIERLNETVFAETHHFTIDDETEIVFVQQSQFPPVVLERFISQQTVASGGGYETGLPYYASKLYLHEVYANDWEWEDWSVSESAMHTVSIVNGTGASATVSDAILRYIDAANAEVVTVKETLTSNKYQAFKYTLSGTDYYWVNDRTHDTWTDDLSAWGYEEIPSVVVYDAYRKADQTTGDVDNIPVFVYDVSGNKILVDKTKKYTITQYKVSSSGDWIANTTAFIADASQEYLQVYTSGSTYSTYCFEYTVEENVDGYATYDMFTNSTGSRTDPQDIHYSGVVLYYNGTRVQYDPGYIMTNRAYSYNFSSRQVYRVSVSNMTNWSIQVGYPDYAYAQLRSSASSTVYASDIIVEKRQASCAYFSPNKSDVSVAYHVNTLIYDENGNTIPYDTTKTYVHSAEKTYDNKWSKLSLSLVNMDGYLGYYCNNTGSGYVSLWYVII